MNFLAHAYLSGNDPHLLIGNFIADFVKGKTALAAFSPEIRKGILLHRAIDAFTDTHPVVSKSKHRLRAKYRHYSGVIVDVFYDHYLATHWAKYHVATLPDFAATTYEIIHQHKHILPERVQEFFPYMVRGNWLVGYAHVEGIARALGGMSRRTPYESKMDEASHDLLLHYKEFEDEFRLFFPELIRHSENFKSENN